MESLADAHRQEILDTARRMTASAPLADLREVFLIDCIDFLLTVGQPHFEDRQRRVWRRRAYAGLPIPTPADQDIILRERGDPEAILRHHQDGAHE